MKTLNKIIEELVEENEQLKQRISKLVDENTHLRQELEDFYYTRSKLKETDFLY